MAETDFGKTTALVKKGWELAVWNYWFETGLFTSRGLISGGIADANNVIHKVDQLTRTSRGLSTIIPLVDRIDPDSAAIVADNQITGREVEIQSDSDEIRIDQLRMGTKNKGKLSEQATVIRFRAQARGTIGDAMAELFDDLCILTLSGVAYTQKINGATRPATSQVPNLAFAADVTAPSSGRIRYAGAATSDATLTATDTINWSEIINTRALGEVKRVKPLNGRGGNRPYILLTHTYGMRDLELDPVFQTMLKSAEKPGPENPVWWNNADYRVGGVAVIKYNRVYNTLGRTTGNKWGASGTIDGCRSLMLGAQALGWASLEDMTWYEGNEDHNNRDVISAGMMFGLLKPRFVRREEGTTAQDYGVIAFDHALRA